MGLIRICFFSKPLVLKDRFCFTGSLPFLIRYFRESFWLRKVTWNLTFNDRQREKHFERPFHRAWPIPDLRGREESRGRMGLVLTRCRGGVLHGNPYPFGNETHSPAYWYSEPGRRATREQHDPGLVCHRRVFPCNVIKSPQWTVGTFCTQDIFASFQTQKHVSSVSLNYKKWPKVRVGIGQDAFMHKSCSLAVFFFFRRS
jgi:hypothetical protein